MSTSLLNQPGEQPPGRVRVASEVVASIAALAAQEVVGIAAMCEPTGVNVSLPLHRQHGHRGVNLQMVGDTGIKLELYVAITPQASISQMAEELQRKVAHAIHSMLGLDAVEINLHIAEIEGD
ncbi:MAG TPA: Asp23/Gls24 family envelope stress response protein [Candidatus Dormibacteraeota bacterium]|nr:Asp23/Gls24 family envelope stress response protein [Candidatus Dormibacteraeota bacterium]